MAPTINNRKNSGEINQINLSFRIYFWPLHTAGTILLFLSMAAIIAAAIVTAAWVGKGFAPDHASEGKSEIIDGSPGGYRIQAGIPI